MPVVEELEHMLEAHALEALSSRCSTGLRLGQFQSPVTA